MNRSRAFFFIALVALSLTSFAASLTSISPASLYEVGPGKPFLSIGAVPWESLLPGDTVLIYYRATPYKEKFVLCRQGTAAERWLREQEAAEDSANMWVHAATIAGVVIALFGLFMMFG